MPELSQKLGVQPGMKVWIINSPPILNESLKSVGQLEWTDGNVPVDFIHLFATHSDTLFELLPACLNVLSDKGMLWVSWPKKAAKVPSDLDRETVREILLHTGLVDVKVCSVDDVWSALKFLRRLSDRK